MHFFRLIALCTYTVTAICASQRALAQTSDRYQGTGSCSSSNCHGSVNPIKGARILQNEYYTWQKHDSHSKAYSVLLQPDAQKMARHLGLGDPSLEPTCLACHTTFVPEKALRGERYSIEDGVSCESCHGASERWLASHAAAGVTHQQNLKSGMFDTANLEKRAKLCLSCHQGDESKRVTHELYGAGHPRLRFELDTYGMLQPKHWIIDEDYRARKEDYIPLKAWFVGQVVQAQGLIELLKHPHAMRGNLPELSMFDCYSCHHSLSKAQWRDRSYGGQPGHLRINTTPLLLVQTALQRPDKPLSDKLKALIAQLHTEYPQGDSSVIVSSIRSLLANEVLLVARTFAVDQQACSDTIRALARLGKSIQPLKFELAEQIGMGIQAAAASYASASSEGTDYVSERSLQALFDTIRSADTFTPAEFIKALPHD